MTQSRSNQRDRVAETELVGSLITQLAADRFRLERLGLPESAARELLRKEAGRFHESFERKFGERDADRCEGVFSRASTRALDFLFKSATDTDTEPNAETRLVETVRLALLDLTQLVGDRSVMFADRIPARPWDDRVANVERVGDVAFEIAGDVANVARSFMAGDERAARLSLAEALVGLALLNHDLGLDAASDLPISIGSLYDDA